MKDNVIQVINKKYFWYKDFTEIPEEEARKIINERKLVQLKGLVSSKSLSYHTKKDIEKTKQKLHKNILQLEAKKNYFEKLLESIKNSKYIKQ